MSPSRTYLGEDVELATTQVPQFERRLVAQPDNLRISVWSLSSFNGLEHEGTCYCVPHYKADNAHIAEHEGDKLSQVVLEALSPRLVRPSAC